MIDAKKSAAELEEIDRLRVQVADEKLGRVRREIELLLLRSGLRAQETLADAERAAVLARVGLEYGLTPEDGLDIDTGQITRKPHLSALP